MGGPLSGIYPFLLHFLVDLVQLCRFDTSNFYFRAILTEKKTIFVLLVVCLAVTKTVGRNVCQVAKLIQVASNFYPKKLQWILDDNQLKFNGRLAQIDMNLIGPAIIAFVRMVVN